MTSKAIQKFSGRALREAGAALKEAGGCEVFTRHRPVIRWFDQKPFMTNDTFIAPTASVIGNVTNWDESSIWYGAVVRADSKHSIEIGYSSSIGDNSVVTTLGEKVDVLEKTGMPPSTHVGHYVSVGAGSVLISCRIDDIVDIGDKCTILEGAYVESHVILEGGTTVLPYQRIPSGQRWGGNPAKFISNLSADEKATIQPKAERIFINAWEHIEEFLPYGNSYVHLEELERANVETKQG